MPQENKVDYGFFALYIGCEYHSTDDKIPDGYISGFSIRKDPDMQFVDILFTDRDSREEIDIPTNCFDSIQLKLRPFESLTEDEWQGIWIRIGGTPHLYEFGLDELKEFLNGNTPDGFSLQFDYFTMSQLINYLRSIEIDCDDLINSGRAIEKQL